MKIPKRAARDFLEAEEVLSLLVAGEVVDNPVKPETTRAADHVRQLRDKERLTAKHKNPRRCRGSPSGASRTRTGGLLGAIQALAGTEFGLFAGNSVV